jgi:hypothetical protein
MPEDNKKIGVEVAELSAKAALAITKPTLKLNWESFKAKVLQFFGGLIMEKKGDQYVVSIGRVAWWMAFIPAVSIWISSKGTLDAGKVIKDISPNHFNILVVLAGYNFGKRITDTAEKIWAKNAEENDGPG